MAKKKTGSPSLLLSFLRWAIVTQSVSLSKPGCPVNCGNITIPYPFGIGSECSKNSSFTVVCQNSSIPFLSRINLEVVYISLKGIVKVKQPVSPMPCTAEQRTLSLVNSLLGSPFIISASYNSLVVLGCQNAGWLRANYTSTTIGGCMAICDVNTTTHNSCNGVNCCQISIIPGLQEPEFTYLSVTALGKNVSFCGYAFLAEEAWFQRDYKTYAGLQHDLLNPFDEEFRFASLVLEWIWDSTLSFNASCYDRDEFNSYNFEVGSTLCSCNSGFEGNPFLPEGCHDIDECSDTTLNNCNGTYCTNRSGSYTCGGTKLPSIIMSTVLNTLL